MQLQNIKNWGVIGDGMADDTAALQAALDSGCHELFIPTGLYRVTTTLRVPSHTHLTAEATARIFLSGPRKHRGDFLLTNANHENGNTDIAICGGVWDGGNRLPENAKPDIFDENGYSGTVLHFFNIKGLTLRRLVVANSVTYNIRMAKISDFVIEDIDFLSDVFGWNQDGLHFGGDVHHGEVRRIRALSKGQTNDDLIALNADDFLTRVENRDLVCGNIEDIVFEDLFAEDCHTIIRLLTTVSAIRNITFRRIYAGYRCNAINADAGRYMRTPLFEETDMPNGVGRIENLQIEDMTCYPTNPNPDTTGPRARLHTALALESHAEGLKISGFKKINPLNLPVPGTALCACNLLNTAIAADGQTFRMEKKEDLIELDHFAELTVGRISK